MSNKIIMVGLVLVASFVNLGELKPMTEEDGESLKLVHIIFRHGDRTNDVLSLYPKDPHINETYAPYGWGELTNKGKKREYRLGKAFRERYDKFLGKSYNPNILEAYSSDKNRTKVSLLLVLASLFPPSKGEIWEEGFNWQPIPTKYLPRNEDRLFFGFNCPNFKKLYQEYLKSPRALENSEKYKELFEYLTHHTGLNVTTFETVARLLLGLQTEEEWGLELPAWTKKVYPEQMETVSPNIYMDYTGTTELKRIVSGYLLQKIIDDTKSKIDGNLKDRKLYLYSGHEINLGFLLNTLDIFKPHVPPYGSYLIFEVHQIGGIYGFKILYQGYMAREPQIMKLPGCKEFCPIDQFVSLVEENLPNENSCGN